MSMTVDDFIATTRQRATTADALAGLKTVVTVTNMDESFALSLDEASRQGGIDFSIAYAHCANETNYFRDDDFTRDKNPAGIGHPDSSTRGIVFESFRAGARFYVGEMLLKLRMPIPPALADARSYAPAKWDQVERIVGGSHGPFPQVSIIDDLNTRFGPNNREAVWMTDPLGPQAIVAKGNRLFPALPDQSGDTVTMPTIPVRWSPVPTGAPNNPSGLLLPGKLIVVLHENGNPNSDAGDEARFLLNGGGEGRVSYHFAVDHNEAFQMFALNELCWHAADGCDNPATDRGCFRGVAIEHCQDRDPVRWAATKRNGAILTAMIIAGHPAIHFGGRAGSFSADRIETHQAVSDTKKHCPEWMLNEGVIPSQIARVKAFLAMDGTPTTTTTAPPVAYPATPIPAPDAISAQGHLLTVNDPDRFECIQGGRLKTAPSMDAPNVDKPPYKANRRYTFGFRTTVDGEDWLISKSGSWALAKNFEQ